MKNIELEISEVGEKGEKKKSIYKLILTEQGVDAKYLSMSNLTLAVKAKQELQWQSDFNKLAEFLTEPKSRIDMAVLKIRNINPKLRLWCQEGKLFQSKRHQQHIYELRDGATLGISRIVRPLDDDHLSKLHSDTMRMDDKTRKSARVFVGSVMGSF